MKGRKLISNGVLYVQIKGRSSAKRLPHLPIPSYEKSLLKKTPLDLQGIPKTLYLLLSPSLL
jgi:hypothetical protein